MANVYRSSDIFCETAHSEMEMCKCALKQSFSIDCLLQFLHRETFHCLARRLRLENTWLLGERIDAFSGWPGRFLLQFHVEDSCKLEGTVLFEFSGCQLDVTGDDSLHLLWFQLSSFGDSGKSASG